MCCAGGWSATACSVARTAMCGGAGRAGGHLYLPCAGSTTTTSLSITNTNHLYPLTPIHWETPVNWRPGGLSAHFPCWCWCPLFLLGRTKDPAKTSFQDRAGQRVPSVPPAAWCGWRAGVWNVMAHRHGADGTLNRHGAQSDGREEEKLCKYCEAQGKGRAKGRPRNVTQRSFIDGGWWISFP